MIIESKGVQFQSVGGGGGGGGGLIGNRPPIPQTFVPLYHRNIKIRMRSEEATT